jgi:hypothetical protein
LLDEVDAIINMLNNVIIVLVMGIDLQVEGDVINAVTDFCVSDGVLVSAEAVITARMPYYLRMAAFWAPNTLPRNSPPSSCVSGRMQLMFSTIGF